MLQTLVDSRHQRMMKHVQVFSDPFHVEVRRWTARRMLGAAFASSPGSVSESVQPGDPKKNVRKEMCSFL